MSSAQQNAANGTASEAQIINTQDVGSMFAHEYYTIMHNDPKKLHCFYGKKSTRVHGTEGKVVAQAAGQQEIHATIDAEEFEDRRVEVTNVDTLPSINGSIIVQVLGKMADSNQPVRRFVQTFFLAVQPSGYYLHNDILRYLKDDADESEPEVAVAPAAAELEPVTETAAAAVAAAAVAAPVAEPQPAEAVPAPKRDEKVDADDVAKPDNEQPAKPVAAEKKPVAAEKPAPAAAAPEPVVAAPAAEDKTKAPKEKPATPTPAPAPKAGGEPTSTPAAAAVKHTSWALMAADGSGKWGNSMAKVEGTVAPAANSAASATPSTPSRVSTPGGGPRETRRTADALSVFLKDIPQGISIGQLKGALKKFGRVYVDFKQHKTTGIAEFETEAEKQAALDAGEVMVAGQKVTIEQRRLRTNSARREDRPGKQSQQSGVQSGAPAGAQTGAQVGAQSGAQGGAPARSGSGEFERVGSGRGTRSRTSTSANPASGNRSRGGKQ